MIHSLLIERLHPVTSISCPLPLVSPLLAPTFPVRLCEISFRICAVYLFWILCKGNLFCAWNQHGFFRGSFMLLHVSVGCPFHWQLVFRWIDGPHFVYPLTCWGFNFHFSRDKWDWASFHVLFGSSCIFLHEVSVYIYFIVFFYTKFIGLSKKFIWLFSQDGSGST